MASVIRLQRLAVPQQGDFAQGAGVSTEQKGNPNVVDADVDFTLPKKVVAADAHGAPWAQPVPVWIAIVVLLFVGKYVIEKHGAKDEYLRIGAGNMVLFFVLWVLVANLGKWIFGYWRIPGISSLVLAA